jgi:GNAT superfamily N-acetyltransferase
MAADMDRAHSIRHATVEDVELLFEIRNNVKENYLTREELAERGITADSVVKMLTSGSLAWIAEVGGDPAGFCMADGPRCRIWAMFIRPEFEGLGIGRVLMRVAEEWLFEKGTDTIWVTTGMEADNRAHGFYESLGWQRVGLTDDGQMRYEKQGRMGTRA